MAIQEISAKGAEPQPVPKEKIAVGLQDGTLDEEKLEKVFIGSIDQGTTSTRFIIFDGMGEPVAQHQIEFTQHYPQSGWHEHDPYELVSTVETCIEKATGIFEDMHYDIADIKAIGITNQRETTVVWDTNTVCPFTMPSHGPTQELKG